MTDGTIEGVTIQLTAGGELKLVSPWNKIKIKNANGTVLNPKPDSRGVISIFTVKGQKLEFVQEL